MPDQTTLVAATLKVAHWLAAKPETEREDVQLMFEMALADLGDIDQAMAEVDECLAAPDAEVPTE